LKIINEKQPWQANFIASGNQNGTAL